MEDVQQVLDVGEVEARRGLVEDVERPPRRPFAELFGELHPLGLSARERRGRLAEVYVVHPHIV